MKRTRTEPNLHSHTIFKEPNKTSTQVQGERKEPEPSRTSVVTEPESTGDVCDVNWQA